MKLKYPIWAVCLAAGALALGRYGKAKPAPAQEPTLIFGRPGTHDGQFHMPREVGFSPDGKRLYILDRSHRVQVFTPEGKFLEMWPTPFGPLGNPRGLDVDPDGNVYVADTHNSQILVFSPKGKLLHKWGTHGKKQGEFVSVTDVALDSKGYLWACEYGAYNDRIQRLDPQGRSVLTVGSFGSGPGQFSRPQGISVHNDRVYIADAVNHRIQILGLDGKVISTWGEVGSEPGKLRYPYDLAFDRYGRLYVAEFGNCRVSVFTPEGRYLTGFGRPGRDPGSFDHPWGVNVARTGEIYVADTMNYRIQKFPALPRGDDPQLRADGAPLPSPKH